MAIARDSTANGTESGASSLTFSHTCAANAVLFVSFYTSGTVSNVKYKAVAMTLVNSHNLSGSVTYLYVLANPSSGANNVVITMTGNSDVTGSSFSYTGANVVTQPGANADGGQSASNPFTTSINTLYPNSWMVLAARNSSGSTSAGTGASSVLDANGLQLYDTNGLVQAGNNSMAVSFGAGTTGTVIAELVGNDGGSKTATDTQASSDSLSYILGYNFVGTDTQGSSDSSKNQHGAINPQKTSSTWTNQQKT